MSYGESIAPLLGRLVLTWFFLTQVYHYTLDWSGTAILLSMKQVPAAPVVLFLVLLLALLGSLSLLLGFRTRIGALALFAANLINSPLSQRCSRNRWRHDLRVYKRTQPSI